jgi:hypothetical protein
VTAIYRAGSVWVLRFEGGHLLYAATLAEAMDLAYRLATGG